jgi:hypothetical protein
MALSHRMRQLNILKDITDSIPIELLSEGVYNFKRNVSQLVSVFACNNRDVVVKLPYRFWETNLKQTVLVVAGLERKWHGNSMLDIIDNAIPVNYLPNGQYVIEQTFGSVTAIVSNTKTSIRVAVYFNELYHYKLEPHVMFTVIDTVLASNSFIIKVFMGCLIRMTRPSGL